MQRAQLITSCGQNVISSSPTPIGFRRKDWTEEQWGHYIWNGECSVEKGKTGGVKWVFRKEGENPYQVGLADVTRTAKGVTLMVWGCFWGSTLGYLHLLLVGHNNSERYVEILEVYLPLVKEDMAAAGTSTPVFMQDNSPIHNSYYSLGWLSR
ncbi:hypothetical protein L211DRAFT_866446 [Terfezia boudieri ATCC MYA-4762]|uniref:Tc1-like transposase DDE domain-containing protein n=1 Tax=Terfezia boudieri ATCC MYA-4762 TaxID=1051890 RepID=A0A3N4LUH9_9PEZI|nr:hypothetical protein L211DRAFT_866446 [Terfezia boudieri ATCC MYA-4762]